jgi:hypothetical protein
MRIRKKNVSFFNDFEKELRKGIFQWFDLVYLKKKAHFCHRNRDLYKKFYKDFNLYLKVR